MTGSNVTGRRSVYIKFDYLITVKPKIQSLNIGKTKCSIKQTLFIFA